MNYEIRSLTFAPDGKDGRPGSITNGIKAIFAMHIDGRQSRFEISASNLDDFIALKEAFTTALANINKAIELELED